MGEWWGGKILGISDGGVDKECVCGGGDKCVVVGIIGWTLQPPQWDYRLDPFTLLHLLQCTSFTQHSASINYTPTHTPMPLPFPQH